MVSVGQTGDDNKNQRLFFPQFGCAIGAESLNKPFLYLSMELNFKKQITRENKAERNV